MNLETEFGFKLATNRCFPHFTWCIYDQIRPYPPPGGKELRDIRTKESERGWGGHFHAFLVFLSTLTLHSVPLFVGMWERSIVLLFILS